jgi:hypothetical protein
MREPVPFDVSTFAVGLYLVQVVMEDSAEKRTFRLMIE